MVHECCRNRSRKRVAKLYLHCQRKQADWRAHKECKPLKTTHKQQIIKIRDAPHRSLSHYFHQTRHWILCSYNIKEHPQSFGRCCLRFRPLSESTKEKYYDLFRQGHSPSSAHLEYETQLTYKDTQLLADRHVNPKISDIYILLINGGNLIWALEQGNICLLNLNKELPFIINTRAGRQ